MIPADGCKLAMFPMCTTTQTSTSRQLAHTAARETTPCMTIAYTAAGKSCRNNADACLRISADKPTQQCLNFTIMHTGVEQCSGKHCWQDHRQQVAVQIIQLNGSNMPGDMFKGLSADTRLPQHLLCDGEVDTRLRQANKRLKSSLPLLCALFSHG
jgi:hypothetical protein